MNNIKQETKRKSTGVNLYEGEIINAVYSPELTYKWGSKKNRGFTLHIQIKKINGEEVKKVLNKNSAIIEINVYSNAPYKYDYVNKETGYTHSRYLNITSPLYQKENLKTISTSEVYISKNLIQKVIISSHSYLLPKKHKHIKEEYYFMRDRKTIFYEIKRPLIKDLWVEDKDIISATSSNSSKEVIYNVPSKVKSKAF